MTQLDSYVARINQVIDHIDAHLAERLDLERLAALAHVSAFHFHRIFQALTGETPGARVRRRRVEVAAQRLLATPPASILQIALEVGFASPEVFARAFKAHFGMTPTHWREDGARAWVEQRRTASELYDAGRWKERDSAAIQVELCTLADAHVAYLRYLGPYGAPEIGQTWERLLSWCVAHGVMERKPRLIGISHDSPELTAPQLLRYDACVEISPTHALDDVKLGVQAVSGGRYACTPFHGTAETIHAHWMRLFSEWLPTSQYQADDRPALELYDHSIAQADDLRVFSCLLCLPIRPS